MDGARVLVVDDNPVNQRVATMMLERLGHHVDVASNGREAVDFALRSRYAVVLMDCEMPVLNGFAATAELRRLLPHTRLPIIAMTASTSEDDRRRCLAADMDDFLPKPVLMCSLESMLGHWLGAPHEARPPQ